MENPRGKQNIWVTGRSGFLGSNIAKELRKSGMYNVCATSFGTTNIYDPSTVLKYVRDYEINGIIHCSGVGGRRIVRDDPADVYLNLSMFESLNQCAPFVDYILYFGSGAEFDRRNDIYMAKEEEALTKVPNEPYGFAKNVINRRILNSDKWYNLRLFGCFHHNEEPQRFIRANIEHRMKGETMIVHQDRYMDFYYFKDLMWIIRYYLRWAGVEPLPKSLNVCYKQKFTLLEIAHMINRAAPDLPPVEIIVSNPLRGLSYCGDGTLLEKTFSFQYCGLESGIRDTYGQLKHNH